MTTALNEIQQTEQATPPAVVPAESKPRKSLTKRRFENRLREKGYKDAQLAENEAGYLDPKINQMWNGYIMAVQDARTNATGNCIIGKVNGDRMEFSPRPYVHRNYKLASKELFKLAQANRGACFVLYQSQTALSLPPEVSEPVPEESDQLS